MIRYRKCVLFLIALKLHICKFIRSSDIFYIFDMADTFCTLQMRYLVFSRVHADNVILIKHIDHFCNFLFRTHFVQDFADHHLPIYCPVSGAIIFW